MMDHLISKNNFDLTIDYFSKKLTFIADGIEDAIDYVGHQYKQAEKKVMQTAKDMRNYPSHMAYICSLSTNLSAIAIPNFSDFFGARVLLNLPFLLNQESVHLLNGKDQCLKTQEPFNINRRKTYTNLLFDSVCMGMSSQPPYLKHSLLALSVPSESVYINHKT